MICLFHWAKLMPQARLRHTCRSLCRDRALLSHLDGYGPIWDKLVRQFHAKLSGKGTFCARTSKARQVTWLKWVCLFGFGRQNGENTPLWGSPVLTHTLAVLVVSFKDTGPWDRFQDLPRAGQLVWLRAIIRTCGSY